MEKKDSAYYYKKYDEIYGLIHSAKSLIEMNKRTKEQITKSDIDHIKNYLVDGIDEIMTYDE